MMIYVFIQSHFSVTLIRDIWDKVNIIIPSVISIIAFISGFFLSNYIENKKDKRNLTRVYDYFMEYFKEQIILIRNQTVSIVKQKVDVSLLKNTGGINFHIISQPYFILDSINKEELFTAWTNIKKKEGKTLIDILKYIEYTKKVFDGYNEHHKEFLLRQREIRDKWNSRCSDFHTLKGDLHSLPKAEIEANSDLFKLNSIYNMWNKIGSEALLDTISNLVMPIKEYYEPIYSKDPGNNIALQLISKVGEIELVFEEWKAEIESYDSYLGEIIKGLEEATKKIPTEV